MADYSEVFVGIDTSKLRNAVAIAEGGRNALSYQSTGTAGHRYLCRRTAWRGYFRASGHSRAASSCPAAGRGSGRYRPGAIGVLLCAAHPSCHRSTSQRLDRIRLRQSTHTTRHIRASALSQRQIRQRPLPQRLICARALSQTAIAGARAASSATPAGVSRFR
jgi:hypothetical protein